jgi:hypothetical protein
VPAHLTAAEARALGIASSPGTGPRARTTRHALHRDRAVSTCHDCGESFDTDAAETRHVAEARHYRYDIDVATGGQEGPTSR